MTRITLTDDIRAQLGGLTAPLVLCDEAGNPLGTFTPVTALTEHQRIAMTLPDHLLNSDTSDDELRRRLHEKGRVPHEEVLREARRYL